MWVTGIIVKILLSQNSKEDLQEKLDDIAGSIWQTVHDAIDGSLHAAKPFEVPLDDWDSFYERSHYFITHATTFELPFELKYPSERIYPACPICGGSGEDRTEKEEDDDHD